MVMELPIIAIVLLNQNICSVNRYLKQLIFTQIWGKSLMSNEPTEPQRTKD